MSEQNNPVAWIRPDELKKAKSTPYLCWVEPTKRMADFVPLYAAPAPVASPAAPAPASLFEDMLQSLEHVEAVYRLNVVKDNGEPSSTLQNLQRVIARAKNAEPAPIYQWREPGRPDTEGWMDCDLARYDEVAKKIAENPRRTHLECRIVYSGAAPADRQGVALPIRGDSNE